MDTNTMTDSAQATNAQADISAQAAIENVVDYGGFHVSYSTSEAAQAAADVKHALEDAGFTILGYNSVEGAPVSAAWHRTRNGTIYALMDGGTDYEGPASVPSDASKPVTMSIYREWDFAEGPDGERWSMNGQPPEATNENNQPLSEPSFRDLDKALTAFRELVNVI